MTFMVCSGYKGCCERRPPGQYGRLRSDRYHFRREPESALLSELTSIESFTPYARRFYAASAYAVAVSVFGGTPQLVATWFIKATGNATAPAWYRIARVIISLIAVSMLEETGGRELAWRSYCVSSRIG